MKRLLLPLLALFIVGCSGTKINKEGEKELKEFMFDFTVLLREQGAKYACNTSRYEVIPNQLKILYLENQLNRKGYISKKTEEAANKIVKYCSVWNLYSD